ncbi:Uncharacterised protein [uncultured archaeon]|nr:Uncharacterised protein [uncultured archaeon]
MLKITSSSGNKAILNTLDVKEEMSALKIQLAEHMADLRESKCLRRALFYLMKSTICGNHGKASGYKKIFINHINPEKQLINDIKP